MSDLKVVDDGIQAAVILDVKELNSPLPLFHVKKVINKITSGQILQVNGSDPQCRKDFTKWCERSGNKYLGEKDTHDYISFYIKKA
jgi:tRNA 2-thiouridine synthesizing protein A